AVALGDQPRFAGGQFVKALDDDGQVGARHRVVKLDENIAGFDAIAVLHVELSDHAAGRVLYFLDVGIDDDGALRDQRAGDLGSRGPATDAESQNQHNDA